MGVFDYYGSAQLKIGHVSLHAYKVGDEVPIPDGIYLDTAAAVVIKGGKFVAEFPHLTSKWGHKMEIAPLLEPIHPILNVIKDLEAEREDKEED